MEISELIRVTRSDFIFLPETRSNVEHTMRHMWPCSRTHKITPLVQPTRAGVALVVSPGLQSSCETVIHEIK